MRWSKAVRPLLGGAIAAAALLAALLAAAASPASPAGDCLPDAAGERRALLEWVNETRAAAGLAPLLADPHLCAIAQARAGEMAAAGSVESDAESIRAVSRGLHGRGYEAHRWTERAILGYDDPVVMAGQWGGAAGSSFQETVLGPFEEVGVGIADAGEATAISLLFAVPRLSELHRVSEPLADLGRVRSEALLRVNLARDRHRLRPVASNPLLDAAAQLYAEEMLRRGFYSHMSPERKTPGDRATAVGYGGFTFLAENIAKGLFEPDEVVERWLDSRDHRDNILHREATETGLGVAFGDTKQGFQVVWVQLFGRR
jgi:uncharacterized protein YkwD